MAVIDKKKQKTRKSKIKQSTAISLLFQPVVAVCCCCLRWEKNQQNLEREKGFVLSACSEFCCCCCCCYFVYRIFTQLQNRKIKNRKRRGAKMQIILSTTAAAAADLDVLTLFTFPLLLFSCFHCWLRKTKKNKTGQKISKRFLKKNLPYKNK